MKRSLHIIITEADGIPAGLAKAAAACPPDHTPVACHVSFEAHGFTPENVHQDCSAIILPLGKFLAISGIPLNAAFGIAKSAIDECLANYRAEAAAEKIISAL